jgi:DNA primase catalytic subunit
MEEQSIREKRIRKITSLYYSKPEIQKAIFEFSKNRETIPRYFEGFGKRPDSFEYKGDIFELVKKGATSFHCSEEIWENPMKIDTGMNEEQLNELRTGWDLLIDIDSKYIDYSKISAELITKVLKFHGIKNIGIKFSGSKGFHIIIPWKAFPKEINNVQTKDKFPEWPRIIVRYLIQQIEKQLIEKVSDLSRPSKYVKDFQAPKEVMPDLVLVSPRHLFRTPYSLHEKTALASVVINPEEISKFDMKDADPMQVEIKDFMPNVEEGEAKELLVQALDWYKENNPEQEEKKTGDFKAIKISNLSENNLPPCIKKILKGVSDGRKRSVFILINLFRSIGMDREELEKRIYSWNEKNNPPLKKGYVKSQLSWSFRGKPIMPPNCKEFYQGIGVCDPDNFCRMIKNPVNYVVRKSFSSTKKEFKTKKK